MADINTQLKEVKHTPRKTAVHEAGHAIVAAYYKMTIGTVSIAQTKDANDNILAGFTEATPNHPTCRAHTLQFLLGGGVAERHVLGEADAGVMKDLDDVYATCSDAGICESDIVSIMKAMALETGVIICKNKGNVNKVANMLMRKQSITGTDVERCIKIVR